LHEVRQPLSGIESVAYYLEMALESGDDELRQQCGRLRTMVRQASWLLDDAALCCTPHSSDPVSASLNDEIYRLACDLALHDERALDLSFADGPMLVAIPAFRVKRIAAHLLSFLHDIAEAEEPVSARTYSGAGWRCLALRGRVEESRCAEFARILTSLWPGGLAGALDGIGGSVSVRQSAASLVIELRLPTPGDE
jgi:hypothetical protein